MHPFLEKFFWKTWFRKKKKSWNVALVEARKKFTHKEFYQYLLWKLTKSEEKKPRRKFRLFPRISPGHLWFALKSPKKPWWILTGSLFLGLTALGFPAYFLGYPLLKEYKFERFKKTARAALDNGDLHTSLLTSQAAHLLKPSSFAALEILVDVAGLSKHPRLFAWQSSLANHPEADFEDRTNYFKHALQIGRVSEAEDWFNNISDRLPEKESVLFECLLLSRLDDEGKFNAYRLASEYLKEHPFSSPLCEFKWDLCMASDQPYLMEEAVIEMKLAASQPSSLSYEALRRLLQLDIGSDEERKGWAKKLWQVTSPSMEDAVLCLNASYGEKRINGKSLLHALRQNIAGFEGTDQSPRLIGLLNQVGRPQTASELLHPEDLNLTAHKQTYLSTIQSAFSENQENLAEELIVRASATISRNEKRFFDLLLNQTPLQTDQLAKMFSDCTNEELGTIRLFLRFFQSPEFLLGFLEEMERRNPHRMGIKYLLATAYHRLGKFEHLREVVKRTEMPVVVGDLAGERQTCIQKSLYGMDIDACTEWAESAFAQNPQSKANRFALALCYIQKKEHENAQALLGPVFQSPPPLCPTQRLIGSVTLHRNNLFELSRKWAPVEHISLLSDAEIKLLRETTLSRP